jgi:hypothetical protein
MAAFVFKQTADSKQQSAISSQQSAINNGQVNSKQ